MSTHKEYWFLKDTEDLAQEINDRFKTWGAHKLSSNLMTLFMKAYKAYYGDAWYTLYSTGTTGEQDEYSTININHLRSVVKAVLAMTTQNKLTFDCTSTSTDVQARNNVVVANAVLNQFFYKYRFESIVRRALELGLMSGTSYVYVGWKTGQKLVDVDGEGNPVYAGEPDIKYLALPDVYCDPFKEEFRDQNIFMFRRMENRYDLMRRYPEKEAELSALPKIKDMGMFEPYYQKDDSSIWVYYAFHKPTPALPQGRFVLCCDNGVVLSDDVNPYECIPVVCYRPDVRFGSAFGHSPIFDLMAIQEAINTADSSALTMLENFAIPNILAGDKFNAEETDLSGGMKLVIGKPDPDAPNGGFPTAMTMPSPNPEYQRLRESYVLDMEKISGVNSAVRGQPQTGSSGTAIALTSSAAQIYNSSVENGYVQMVEEVASMLLQVCRLFMKREELVTVTGVDDEYSVTTFTSANLESIHGVTVYLGNPLAKTLAGRVEIATQLLNQQQINAKQFMEVLKTGNLGPSINKGASAANYLKLENEQLLRGEKPVISPLDNSLEHIVAHHDLINNPLVRSNAAIMGLVLEHIADHNDMMIKLSIENPMMLDISLGNPPRIPAPGPDSLLGPQDPNAAPPGQEAAPTGAPQLSGAGALTSQTAEAAAENGPEVVANSAMKRASNIQASANQQSGVTAE